MEYRLNEVFEFIRNGASIKQFDTKFGYPITRIETIANSYIDTNKMGSVILVQGEYELKSDSIYVENIILHHLETYKDEINRLAEMKFRKLL